MSLSSESTMGRRASVQGGGDSCSRVDGGTFLHLKSRCNKAPSCIIVLCCCVCVCNWTRYYQAAGGRAEPDKETTETDGGSWRTARSVLGPRVLSSKHQAIDSLQIDADFKWLSSAMSVGIGLRRIMGH